MPNTNAQGNRFHVVTYARIKGQDGEDVVAEGTVTLPVGDAKDGDLVEGILSHVDKFQCDGHGHETNGCQEEHGRALERIRARLTGDDGKVAVICRKYHPLVGKGTAEPGKPFEAEWDGVAIRVEVRRILEEEAEGLTDDSVSLLTLRKMQTDLAPKVQLADARMRVRSAFAKLADTHIEAVQEQIAEHKARYADLPAQDAVKDATDQVEAAAQTIVDEAGELLKTALDNEKLDVAGAKVFQQQLTALEPRFAQIFGPYEVIEQQAAELLAGQQAIRQRGEAAAAILDRHEDAGARHKKLDFDTKPIAAIKKSLDGLLAKTKKADAIAQLPALVQEAEPLTAQIEAQAALLDTAIGEAEAKARAFASRVSAHDQWRTDRPAALLSLEETVGSIGAFAEVPLAYWVGQIAQLDAALGDLTDISALRYDDVGAAKQLAAAEKELKPVADLFAALGKDMKPVVDGSYAPLQIAGANFVAPTAWAKVTRAHNDGKFDVDLHLIDNDPRAMQLQILVGPDQQVLRDVVLTERGERLSLALQQVDSPIAFRITAVVPDDGPPPIDGVAKMNQVDVPSADLPFQNDGATHYNLPSNWTPVSEKIGGAVDVNTAHAADLRVTKQPIFGNE